jgi:copper chaperone CopZ
MMKLKTDGMACSHCVEAVSHALSSRPGVERVRHVDLKSGEVTIEGSPNVGDVVRAILAERYSPRLLD